MSSMMLINAFIQLIYDAPCRCQGALHMGEGAWEAWDQGDLVQGVVLVRGCP